MAFRVPEIFRASALSSMVLVGTSAVEAEGSQGVFDKVLSDQAVTLYGHEITPHPANLNDGFVMWGAMRGRLDDLFPDRNARELSLQDTCKLIHDLKIQYAIEAESRPPSNELGDVNYLAMLDSSARATVCPTTEISLGDPSSNPDHSP